MNIHTTRVATRDGENKAKKLTAENRRVFLQPERDCQLYKQDDNDRR